MKIFSSANLASIKRFLERLPYEEVRSAAESACGRFGVSTRAFRYFCGICWAKIREGA